LSSASLVLSQLHAIANSSSRLGSFIVVGDWGFDWKQHGNIKTNECQKTIAKAMDEKMKELGDVKFIINVGDSFYPEGVKSRDDPQWDVKWRNIYHQKLRNVPWYSVYGNHDYHHDPCACSTDPAQCAQVNWNWFDRSHFYMPGFNYYRAHEEMDLEVIGLDLNRYMDGWNGTKKRHELNFTDCVYTPCKDKCFGNMDSRAEQGFELFYKRQNVSKAKNLVVFSHYPTDYFSSEPKFQNALRQGWPHDIVYFGGHRHNVDNTSTASIFPNVNWLVGGGGGWSCDGAQQGFLVAEVGKDSKITTYPVLVDKDICCPPPKPTKETW